MNPSFEQGFIATRYLLGTRGEAVAEGLISQRHAAQSDSGSPRDALDSAHVIELVTQLQSPDRTARSHALAGVLQRLVIELEARRIG